MESISSPGGPCPQRHRPGPGHGEILRHRRGNASDGGGLPRPGARRGPEDPSSGKRADHPGRRPPEGMVHP